MLSEKRCNGNLCTPPPWFRGKLYMNYGEMMEESQSKGEQELSLDSGILKVLNFIKSLFLHLKNLL